MIDKESFKQYILEGKTIPQLQEIYGVSRTKIAEAKKAFGFVGLTPNSKKLDRDKGSKICPSCNKEKSFKEFYSNGTTSTGKIKYKPKCVVCENSSRKENYRTLIEEYLNIKNIKYCCSKCGYNKYKEVLDFHHTSPIEKDFNIFQVSSSISTDRFIEEVIPELDKCILLCPTCHREEHLLMGLT